MIVRPELSIVFRHMLLKVSRCAVYFHFVIQDSYVPLCLFFNLSLMSIFFIKRFQFEIFLFPEQKKNCLMYHFTC